MLFRTFFSYIKVKSKKKLALSLVYCTITFLIVLTTPYFVLSELIPTANNSIQIIITKFALFYLLYCIRTFIPKNTKNYSCKLLTYMCRNRMTNKKGALIIPFKRRNKAIQIGMPDYNKYGSLVSTLFVLNKKTCQWDRRS